METSKERSKWAVVGAGMLGLATAWKLAKRGEKVVVYESGPEIGGLTAAWQLGDVTWDKFYHVTLLSDTRLRDLLHQWGLDDGIQWVQTRTGFYSGGKLYSLSNSFEFLLFPVLSFYQKMRLGSTIFFGSKIRNWQALERVPVEDWLRKWSGNSTFEKIWLPLLRAKLGNAYSRVSAAFIWAYIDRMYKARRSGMKTEMFGYVPGGYAHILRTARKKLEDLGVEFRTNAPVRTLQRKSNRIEIIRATKENVSDKTVVDESSQSTEVFDRVVLTVPSPVIRQCCPELNAEEVDRLNRVEYLGVVCTSILLDRPLGGYYVTNVTDNWVPFTGIIEMGAIVKPEKLDGNYLVYLPQYLLSDDERLNESDEEIHTRCFVTLEKMYPGFDRSQVRAIQTGRAKYVMALPTLRYSEFRPPVACSIPGLYLLNSARIVKGNLNVNESLELLEEDFEGVVWPDHLQLSSEK